MTDGKAQRPEESAQREARSEPIPTPEGQGGGERRVHELKTWPPYFAAVKRGEKPFEIRKNDRDYRVGDWLRLLEWLPAMECYTGEEHEAQITYMLDGGSFGLESGFCVLGLSSPRVEEVRREAIDALELIEVDLEAGDMAAKVRVKHALSRTKAWLAKFRALSLQVG